MWLSLKEYSLLPKIYLSVNFSWYRHHSGNLFTKHMDMISSGKRILFFLLIIYVCFCLISYFTSVMFGYNCTRPHACSTTLIHFSQGYPSLWWGRSRPILRKWSFRQSSQAWPVTQLAWVLTTQQLAGLPLSRPPFLCPSASGPRTVPPLVTLLLFAKPF